MKSKCCSGTCSSAVIAKCPWKLIAEVDGAKVHTEKRCDLPLCDEHGIEAAPGKRLCPWHNKLFTEEKR